MKYIIKVCVALCITIIVSFFFSKNTFEKIELSFYDWRLKNSYTEEKISLPFAVIGITSDFENVVGEVFSRKHYTQLIRILEREGVSSIGFDIYFPQITDEKIDLELIETIRKSKKVVLPVFSPSRILKRDGPFYIVDEIRSSAPEFNSAAISSGHINTLPDVDQVIRRVPVYIKTEKHIYPQLSIEMVNVARGKSNLYPPFSSIPSIFRKDGSLYIRLLSPLQVEKYFIPFEDVLKGKYPENYFKKKVVLIGQTIVGAKNADLIPTPLGTQFGVIFQAAVLHNTLAGSYIKRLEPSVINTGLLTAGILTCPLFLSGSIIGSTLLLFGLGAAFIYLSLFLMRHNIFLDTIPFLILFGGLYISSLVYSLVEVIKKLLEKEETLKSIQKVEKEITDTLSPSEITGLSGETLFSGIGETELIRKTPDFTMRTLLTSLGIEAGVLINLISKKKYQIIAKDGEISQKEIEMLLEKFTPGERPVLLKGDTGSERIKSLLILPVLSFPTFKIIGIFINKHPSLFSKTPYFSMDDLPVINTLSLQAILAIQNAKLNLALRDTQKETIFRLSVAIEYRDRETGIHINRVSEYAALIAKNIGLSEYEVELIRSAMPLHDIGKIAIPDHILLKPGKLTPEEREIIQQHPIIGAKMLEGSNSLILRAAESIALYHHERYNGSGYPFHLKGTGIPIYGRIAAIADVFDAMTSKRVYKDPAEFEEAISLLEKEAGEGFDPLMVEAFLKRKDEILRIQEMYQEKEEKGEVLW